MSPLIQVIHPMEIVEGNVICLTTYLARSPISWRLTSDERLLWGSLVTNRTTCSISLEWEAKRTVSSVSLEWETRSISLKLGRVNFHVEVVCISGGSWPLFLHVTGCYCIWSDKGIKLRIKTTHDGGKKILIINGLTNCSKLICIGFSTPEIFSARFGSLLKTLKLELHMRNSGSGLRSKHVA